MQEERKSSVPVTGRRRNGRVPHSPPIQYVPQYDGTLERYHRTFREEGWQGEQPPDYPAALALIAAWVETYNRLRLHSALQYLTPWDYYRGDPVARMTERRTKLQTARTRRREAWEAYYAAAHPAA